jgi:hypothetical protein
MAKLLKPTSDAKKAMASLGVSMGFVTKSMDKGDIVGIFSKVVEKMKEIPSKAKRAALMSRIFGIRGQTMAAAMNLSGRNLERFTETLGLMRKETGKTAEQMRDIRLKTFSGQVTLLKSAFEGLSIEVFNAFGGETAGLVRRVADAISGVTLNLRAFAGEKLDPKALKQLAKTPKVFGEIALGIREGLGDVKKFFVELGGKLGWLGKKFGLTGDGSARSMAKIITKVTLLVAALAPVGLAVAGVTRLFAGLAQVAVGAAKVVGNTLALAAKGAGGLLGAVGKRFPKVGGLLGKFGGLLGKAGKLTEQVTAQPVRVVNFHEAGMMGGATSLLGGTSGARELDLAGRGAAGTLTRFRAGLAGAVGRLGKFGGFLNSAALSASSAGGALGKAGLAGAAFAGGYAIGTMIDKWTGASEKISDFFMNRLKKQREMIYGPARRLAISLNQTSTSARMLNQMIAAQQKFGGVGVRDPKTGKITRQAVTQEFARKRLIATLQKTDLNQKQIATQLARLAPLLAKLPKTAPGAKVKPPKPAKDAFVTATGLLPVSAGDVLLDRASLAGAVVSQMRGGLAGRAGAGALGGGDPGRTSPAPAGGGELRIEVPVEIDGRQIALAVARVKLDDLERSGAKIEPGSRAALLQRGFDS